jgi:predicted dehydrogenase
MTVPVGICSTAHVNAGVYAALLSKLPEVDLVGISEQTTDQARKRANAVGTSTMSHHELMQVAEGVIICSTTAAHNELIDLALQHNVAILLEKPIATSLAEAKSIQNQCDESDVVTGMAMPLRYSHPMRQLKERYEAGSVGELVAVSGVNRGRMPGGWFVNPELAGGGAVADHTDHIVDIVRWITGEEVREVYAETDTRFYDLPVEDVNLLSMTLSNGASFFLDGSWSTPQKNSFWGDGRVELVGTKSTFSADCFGDRYTHVKDTAHEMHNESIYWGADPNNALLRGFVMSIQGESAPATTFEDAVRTAAVIDAAYESVEQGKPVKVTY